MDLSGISREDLVLRRDGQNHIAVAFKFTKNRVDYIALACEGPQCFYSTPENFKRLYKLPISVEPSDFAVKVLRAVRRAYLPDPSVAPVLLAMIRLDQFGDGGSLETASHADLVAYYNILQGATGGAVITEKSFRKAKLLAELVSLETALCAFTPEQLINKKSQQAAAEKRLAGLDTLKKQKAEEADAKRAAKAASPTTQKEASMAKSVTPTKAAKPAAKPTKAAPVKESTKPIKTGKAKAEVVAEPTASVKKRGGGVGIGDFCRQNILDGLTNEEIADAARVQFGSKTSASSVAWYRNQLKAAGKLK